MTTELKSTAERQAHTSGPWEVDGGIKGYAFAVIKPLHLAGSRAGDHVAVADIPAPSIHEKEAEANARLIAAAPDLLDALKSVLAQFEAGMFQRNTDSDGCSAWAVKAAGQLRVLADAQRAIAKAEGGAQ